MDVEIRLPSGPTAMSTSGEATSGEVHLGVETSRLALRETHQYPKIIIGNHSNLRSIFRVEVELMVLHERLHVAAGTFVQNSFALPFHVLA
jgi:hypothetical protein